jgi:hypothetical protein
MEIQMFPALPRCACGFIFWLRYLNASDTFHNTFIAIVIVLIGPLNDGCIRVTTERLIA